MSEKRLGAVMSYNAMHEHDAYKPSAPVISAVCGPEYDEAFGKCEAAEVAPAVHVMLDLETWSTGSDAAIISIGAVKFDPHGTDMIDRFHVGICPALADRRQIDPQTILWWMDPERRDALDQWLAMRKVTLFDALYGFVQWFGNKSLPVWGNGADFDNVILANAYRACSIEPPWKFSHNRCYRTLKNMYKIAAIPHDGKHDALNDATAQAVGVQSIVKACNL
jgi:hypothetical protein